MGRPDCDPSWVGHPAARSAALRRWRTTGEPLAMSEAARDPLAELARLLPTVLDESALHELAARLQPLLPAGEALETGKRLYTAREAAELVGVNIETVRRAIRSGQLGVAGRIGRSPRISRDAIDRVWPRAGARSSPCRSGPCAFGGQLAGCRRPDATRRAGDDRDRGRGSAHGRPAGAHWRSAGRAHMAR